MKKTVFILFVIVIVVALAGCTGTQPEKKQGTAPENTSSVTQPVLKPYVIEKIGTRTYSVTANPVTEYNADALTQGYLEISNQCNIVSTVGIVERSDWTVLPTQQVGVTTKLLIKVESCRMGSGDIDITKP